MLERHSSQAQQWLAAEPVVWMTPLHVAEVTHAIEQHVFWKKLTQENAVRLHETFKQHRETGFWKQVALPESVYFLCVELARRHCGRLGMRTLDTLHIASALELGCTEFWTLDDRQAALAKAEGITTRSIKA